MKNKNNSDDSKGQGWYGDSEGHADAGRKGGQTRSDNNQNKTQQDTGQTIQNTTGDDQMDSEDLSE